MAITGVEELEGQLLELKKKIEDLQKVMGLRVVVFPPDGRIVVPVVSADPSSPVNGQIWYNSALGTFRVRQAGANRTISTT